MILTLAKGHDRRYIPGTAPGNHVEVDMALARMLLLVGLGACLVGLAELPAQTKKKFDVTGTVKALAPDKDNKDTGSLTVAALAGGDKKIVVTDKTKIERIKPAPKKDANKEPFVTPIKLSEIVLGEGIGVILKGGSGDVADKIEINEGAKKK
jgi:hypothetical protein